jgi:hypothetical protein
LNSPDLSNPVGDSEEDHEVVLDRVFGRVKATDDGETLTFMNIGRDLLETVLEIRQLEVLTVDIVFIETSI